MAQSIQLKCAVDWMELPASDNNDVIAEFTQKLGEYLPWKGREEAAKQLIIQASTKLHPQDIVDLIFAHAEKEYIQAFLKAVEQCHPNFVLSPCRTVCKEIACNAGLGKEALEGLSVEERKLCFSLADRLGHRCIYSPKRFLKAVKNWYSSHVEGLIQLAPAEVTPEEIAKVALQNIWSNYSAQILDAVSKIYPQFTVAPFYTICLQVIEDKENLLTNKELEELCQQYGITDDEKKFIYDRAYCHNRYRLYQPASLPVEAHAYTINMLWINLEPQDRMADTAEHIFGKGTEEAPFMLTQLERWAEKSQGTKINLWYDSALVTERARHQTWEKIRVIAEAKGVDITLRDVRQLPNIPEEIRRSLHPATPVYYRVDILKALIADHLFSAPEQYTVVTDGDVTPMDRRELFDKRTLQYLDESGYVFNRVGYSNFENSFFIFHKNEKLREIHRKTVIHEVEKRITSVRSEPQGTVFYTQYCLGSQEVWDRYLDFRTKILEDVDKGSVRVPRKVVQCPSSSFGLGSIHSDKDHQNKTWRFIGDSHVPYTRNGRSGGSEERQIAHLVDWQEEILSDVR